MITPYLSSNSFFVFVQVTLSSLTVLSERVKTLHDSIQNSTDFGTNRSSEYKNGVNSIENRRLIISVLFIKYLSLQKYLKNIFFREIQEKNHGLLFFNVFRVWKRSKYIFCHISPETRSLFGWDQSYLKPDILGVHIEQ